MLKQLFTPSFTKNLLINDGLLVVLIIFYNLLAFLIPIVKISLLASVIFLIIVTAAIIILKFLTLYLNQRF